MEQRTSCKVEVLSRAVFFSCPAILCFGVSINSSLAVPVASDRIRSAAMQKVNCRLLKCFTLCQSTRLANFKNNKIKWKEGQEALAASQRSACFLFFFSIQNGKVSPSETDLRGRRHTRWLSRTICGQMWRFYIGWNSFSWRHRRKRTSLMVDNKS